jgi:hypothetical protein
VRPEHVRGQIGTRRRRDNHASCRRSDTAAERGQSDRHLRRDSRGRSYKNGRGNATEWTLSLKNTRLGGLASGTVAAFFFSKKEYLVFLKKNEPFQTLKNYNTYSHCNLIMFWSLNHLRDQAIIRVKGRDAVKFLQGLTTQGSN